MLERLEYSGQSPLSRKGLQRFVQQVYPQGQSLNLIAAARGVIPGKPCAGRR
jgi:hypothetical protein